MSTKTDHRAKEILHLLLRQGKTTIEDLTSALNISPASIRRDLARLEQKGLVYRTHGGAMLAEQNEQAYEPFRLDASFAVREDRFTHEKQHIAKAAALMVNEDDTIGLTAGTTTSLIARYLGHFKKLQVVTNGVNIGIDLSKNPRILTTLTGGYLRWEGAFSLVGPPALETLNTVVLHRLFLGVTGMDPVHGATIIHQEEAAIFRAMARAARKVVVVCDSSKISLVSPAVICPVSQVETLITDNGISEDAIEKFTRSGVKVLIA